MTVVGALAAITCCYVYPSCGLRQYHRTSRRIKTEPGERDITSVDLWSETRSGETLTLLAHVLIRITGWRKSIGGARPFGVRSVPRVKGRSLHPALVLAVLAASTAPALAHVGADLTPGSAWSDWDLTPDIVVPVVLVAVIYALGMTRRRTVVAPASWWRHAMFFGGLAAIFLALQSPIDPVAEHLFFVHQIQHLLLRMLGPMLLALSWPEGTLTAGLPAAIRRTVLSSVVSNTAVRATFRILAQPVVATAFFIGVLCFWEIPRYHDFALLNEPVHYVMHVTMLFAGLVFWWRIFDRRSPPQGLRYGVRLMMVWLVILSNIVLGAFTTLKGAILYPAYDVLGRLYDYAPLADEEAGGFIIWVAGSMMCLLAVLVVIHMWGREEARLDERHAGWLPSMAAVRPYPTSAAALIEQQKSKNRVLAFGFAAFAAAVFAMAILVGLLNGLPTGAATAVGTSDGLVQHVMHQATHR